MLETFTSPLVFRGELADLVLLRVKDVTRRLVRGNTNRTPWRVGARCKAYRKSPMYGGTPIAELLIIDARLEELGRVTRADVAREGFQESRLDFIKRVRGLYAVPAEVPDVFVWRVEFRLVRILPTPA